MEIERNAPNQLGTVKRTKCGRRPIYPSEPVYTRDVQAPLTDISHKFLCCGQGALLVYYSQIQLQLSDDQRQRVCLVASRLAFFLKPAKYLATVTLISATFVLNQQHYL